MNSPKRYPEDELDHVVRGALKARVSQQEPPDRVWERIRLELETAKPAPTRRSQLRWGPLAVQAALTLLLVWLGGMGLQTFLTPDSVRRPTPDVLPSQSIVYVDEQAVSPGVAIPDEEAELRSLKASARSRLALQANTEPDSYPLEIPQDVPPNGLSPAGRALQSELAWLRLADEEQSRLPGGPYHGPYQWFR